MDVDFRSMVMACTLFVRLRSARGAVDWGVAELRQRAMTTDEIMALSRGDEDVLMLLKGQLRR
jgi:hypothetical protein